MKSLFFALGCCFAFAVDVFAEGGGFQVASPTWHEGGTVPKENLLNGSGCGGANLSPAFHWSGAPSGTKSFALTIYDLDAPTGGGWWHWVIFNIPGNASEMHAGAGSPGSKEAPPGALQCQNDYGSAGYGGPCPPSGSTHRYLVRLYALNIEKLPAGPEMRSAKVAKQIEEHSIGIAKLTVRFGR